MQLIMTTIVYRGATYNREKHHADYLKWWSLVHRATLWLCYRGIEYRPVLNQTGPSVF